MYALLKPLLFRLPAEQAHDLTISSLAFVSRHPGLLKGLSLFSGTRDDRLAVNAFGLDFENPLMLAAGLDKNAACIPAWAALGFGAAEVGTVTLSRQAGNPRPRLFRLPADAALINRMGFNNEGAKAVRDRLERLGNAADPESDRPARMPVGVNVGKSRDCALEEAAADYRESLRLVWPHADYVVLNVSSPNTPGLRQLQERGPLVELLELASSLQEPVQRPVLLKIAPDLSDAALTDICVLAEEHGLAGLIATNTTIGRDGLTRDPGEAGGLSGRPLKARSYEVLRFLRARTSLPLVSAGGIDGAHEAVRRVRAGATLLQVYTALIYRGPGLVRDILRGLLRELEREGLSRVSELVGLDAER